jgi:hypothetical protein
MTVSPTILTVFAGRKHNIDVLRKYLSVAIQKGIIQEVHYWNNTRNKEDEEYIKTISNPKRTSSTGNGVYLKLNTPIRNNEFSVKARAPNDVHLKIQGENNVSYEIVIGGWSNTKTVIRHEEFKDIISIETPNVCNAAIDMELRVKIENRDLFVFKNEELLIQCELPNPFQIEEIYCKTGCRSVGYWSYEVVEHVGFYFMDTCEKSWRNYYQHYTDSEYQSSIIIKCDDDIAFIDLDKLPDFIEYARGSDYDLLFANTINNGVSAFFQQHKYGLIPKELMMLEYPNNGLCGSLWESGKKAETLHEYFLENHTKFLTHDYNKDVNHITTRFSINFFAYKCRNWHLIADCFVDDERMLTVDFVRDRGFRNAIYSDFIVAHLSFYKQNETGLNSLRISDKYSTFADEYLKSRL